MCGIVGCVGDLSGTEEKLFKHLLVIDSLRGEDSTGVAAANKDSEVLVAKTVGDPFQLMETNAFADIMRRKNVCLIGHNRAATTGKVVRKNAHPFEFEKLVGVHNGTLRNKHVLDDAHKFDTDSEALYSQISNKGLQETIAKVNGAYSLVWYDKEEHTINFLRNEERPMTILFSQNKKVMFFASEAWMLLGVLGREGYKHGPVEILPVDQHFSYQIPGFNQEFEKGKVRAVEGSPFSKKQQTGGNSNKTSTGTTKKGKNREYPSAEEFIKNFKNRKSSNSHWAAKVDEEVVGKATYWSQHSGAFYVVFNIPKYEGAEFRCYMKDAAECRAVVDHHGDYKAKISRMHLEQKTYWVYKLNPDSLTALSSSPKLTLVDTTVPREPLKADHEKVFINKAEFELRYSNCQWCQSPVTFEEKWHPIKHNECLCESCATDPEIMQYVPELKAQLKTC